MTTRHIVYSVAIGVLAFGVLAAITMLFISRSGVLPTPPIRVYDTIIENDLQGVCPGDEITLHTKIDIFEPSIIELNVAILNEEESVTWLPSNPVMQIPRPEDSEAINVTTKWVVPDLPPGNYVRVAAISSRNADSTPIFNNIPFTISSSCP